jgi:hypothetical protein
MLAQQEVGMLSFDADEWKETLRNSLFEKTELEPTSTRIVTHALVE